MMYLHSNIRTSFSFGILYFGGKWKLHLPWFNMSDMKCCLAQQICVSDRFRFMEFYGLLLIWTLRYNAQQSARGTQLWSMTCCYLSSINTPSQWQWFQDAVINLRTLKEISAQLGFEWTVLADELGFNRAQIGRFHTSSKERSVQARTMLESWYNGRP